MTDADELRRVVEIVLGDFQRPRPVDLGTEVGVMQGQGIVHIWQPDGSGTGIWLEPDLVGDGLMVRVADVIQDQVFDQLPEAWGEARPPCPGHQHPAVPRLVDEQAWWVCPRSEELVGRIGALG